MSFPWACFPDPESNPSQTLSYEPFSQLFGSRKLSVYTVVTAAIAAFDAFFAFPLSLRRGFCLFALVPGSGAVGSAPDFFETLNSNGGVVGFGLRWIPGIGLLPV